MTGASLGLIWVFCAGPILATGTNLATFQVLSLGKVRMVIFYAIGSGFRFIIIMHLHLEGKLKPSGSSKNTTITTILIIIILLGIFGAIGYFSGLFYFLGLTPCNPPSWVVVDGVATQKVFAFYDDNQNGLYEESTERVLPNITVKLLDETAMTNDKGTTTIYVYKEGCACNCSKGDTLSVIIPDGWQTTTPTQYELTGKEETISLGFFK